MLVSLSTMPAGENYLEYIQKVQNFADFVHLDVCDGMYNSTKCFLPEYAQKINQNTTLPIDCHLMTKNVLPLAKQYIKAGANIVTAQIESFQNKAEVLEFINYVKSHNALCGLALEPETEIADILQYIEQLDLVLVMAVPTGKSGQDFDAKVLPKIEQINSLKHNYNFKIEVDGGITNQTVQLVKNIGVDIVVSGKFVFDATDAQNAINQLKI